MKYQMKVNPPVKNKMVMYGIVLGLVVAAAVPSYYFYSQYQKTKQLLQNPSAAAQEDLQSTVNKVGILMDLPKNEVPTFAVVSDVKKLKGQTFFAHAENGDKVLIYTKSQKAILYRPSINKIIDVAPVSLGQTQNQTQGAAKTLSPSPKNLALTIYNGSNSAGLAATTQQKIEDKFSQVKVTGTGNAKGEYSKTFVYDLTGKNKDIASQIAQFLSGEVSSNLPSSEVKPSTDLLVIVVK